MNVHNDLRFEHRSASRHITTEELSSYQDEPLGTSSWMKITQLQIDRFAQATGDVQWIHVDPERASHGPFGATIAHGYLLLSVVPILLKELIQIVDSGRGVNYGVDEVRFTAPVRVDREVALSASVGHAISRSDGGLLYSVDFVLHIRGTERPAMVGRTLYVVYANDVH